MTLGSARLAAAASRWRMPLLLVAQRALSAAEADIDALDSRRVQLAPVLPRSRSPGRQPEPEGTP